jgi:hypothetical protein
MFVTANFRSTFVRPSGPGGANPRALKLNQSENHYLHLFFRKDEPVAESGSRGARVALRALVYALTHMPAFLMDKKLDIVELNQFAETLIFGKPSVETMNLARNIFSDPRSRSRYVDWREKAEIPQQSYALRELSFPTTQ